MLRNEIQKKTGLTRKAIEYYEEKGLINPKKVENGYRDYSDKDLDVLIKISLFRKIGMSILEIESCLSSDGDILSSVLRRRQHQLDIDERKKEVLELIIKGENQEIINRKLELIESEESIYERLERIFPGYFGQMIFSAYQPFLNEPLEKDEEEYFKKYIEYLDKLPNFELTKDEQSYIEKISSAFDTHTLKEVNKSKIEAIENAKEWLKDNKDAISQYEFYKNSEEYKNSMMKQIQDKLKEYMKDNKYYEIAIPLIRKFSKSYNNYYEKLLKANEQILNLKG